MDGNQQTVTVSEFVEQYAHFPATVESVEEHPDGWSLITIDNDHDSDILTYFDDRPAVRRGETKDNGDDNLL